MSSTRDIQVALRDRVLPAGTQRYGLVIGIQTYLQPELNLRGPQADAQAIYDLMVDPDCGLFPIANMRLLLNEQATHAGIRQELSRLRKRVGRGDTVWVYFAGHAAKEGEEAYWVNYEADVDDLYGTALSARFISDALGEVPADRLLLLLDCCHAAAFGFQKSRTRAVLGAEDLLAAYEGTGRVILASSDRNEEATESGVVPRGVFTYFLERGLQGEADLNHDGVVTADELWTYLNQQVQSAARQHGRRQTPVQKGEQTHQLALTLNRRLAQSRQRTRAAIKDRLGRGEAELSPDEADLCLRILDEGPRNGEERDVAAEFEGLVNGATKIKTFKRMVQLAMRVDREQGGALGPRPGSAAYQDEKARRLEQEDYARVTDALATAEMEGLFSQAIAIGEYFAKNHPESPRQEVVSEILTRLRRLKKSFQDYEAGLEGEFGKVRESIEAMESLGAKGHLVEELGRRLEQAAGAHERQVAALGALRAEGRLAELKEALEKAVRAFPRSPRLDELVQTNRHEQAYAAAVAQAADASKAGDPARAMAVWESYLAQAAGVTPPAKLDAWPGLRQLVEANRVAAQAAIETLRSWQALWQRFEGKADEGDWDAAMAVAAELEHAGADVLARNARQRVDKTQADFQQALAAARQALAQHSLADAGAQVQKARKLHASSTAGNGLEQEIEREVAQRDEWIQAARDAGQISQFKEAIALWSQVAQIDLQWPECQETIQRLRLGLKTQRRRFWQRVGRVATVVLLVLGGVFWADSAARKSKDAQNRLSLEKLAKEARTEAEWDTLGRNYLSLLRDRGAASNCQYQANTLRETQQALKEEEERPHSEEEWEVLARRYESLRDASGVERCRKKKDTVVEATLEAREKAPPQTEEEWEALAQDYLTKVGNEAAASRCRTQRDGLVLAGLIVREGQAHTEADYEALAKDYETKLKKLEESQRLRGLARDKFAPTRAALEARRTALAARATADQTPVAWRQLADDFQARLKDTVTASNCLEKAKDLESDIRHALATREIMARTEADWRALAEEYEAKLGNRAAAADCRAKALAVVLKDSWTRLMGASATTPYVNSLQMEFIPVEHPCVVFSRYETRVQDYQVFAGDLTWKNGWNTTNKGSGAASNFKQASMHPAVNVNRLDAEVFCDWLTDRERARHLLNASQSYRLPTDAEWSWAVRLSKETGDTPRARSENGKNQETYPWGDSRVAPGNHTFPPPRGAGNYDPYFQTDKEDHTAPVGQFGANRYGLYDLGGNVWEWCQDPYDEENEKDFAKNDLYGVLRGASWWGGDPGSLKSSYRFKFPVKERREYIGFRCVLVIGSPLP